MKTTDQQKAINYHYDLLRSAHIRAAKRLGFRIGNMGWVVTDNAYVSKTSGGILETVKLGFGKYEHKVLEV